MAGWFVSILAAVSSAFAPAVSEGRTQVGPPLPPPPVPVNVCTLVVLETIAGGGGLPPLPFMDGVDMFVVADEVTDLWATSNGMGRIVDADAYVAGRRMRVDCPWVAPFGTVANYRFLVWHEYAHVLQHRFGRDPVVGHEFDADCVAHVLERSVGGFRPLRFGSHGGCPSVVAFDDAARFVASAAVST